MVCVFSCAALRSVARSAFMRPPSHSADASGTLCAAIMNTPICNARPSNTSSTPTNVRRPPAALLRSTVTPSEADIAALQQTPQCGNGVVGGHGHRMHGDARRFEIDAVLRAQILFDTQQIAVDGAVARQRH